MAIQDAQTALKWVQSNIDKFGGDPEHVMLFAQSAGAANAFTLSTTEGISDLVSGIVLESGGGQDVTPKETAERSGQSYANQLKCKDVSPYKLHHLHLFTPRAAHYPQIYTTHSTV